VVFFHIESVAVYLLNTLINTPSSKVLGSTCKNLSSIFKP